MNVTLFVVIIRENIYYFWPQTWWKTPRVSLNNTCNFNTKRSRNFPLMLTYFLIHKDLVPEHSFIDQPSHKFSIWLLFSRPTWKEIFYLKMQKIYVEKLQSLVASEIKVFVNYTIEAFTKSTKASVLCMRSISIWPWNPSQYPLNTRIDWRVK